METITNQGAHNLLNAFHNACNQYNEHGFLEDIPHKGYLKAILSICQDALTLFKFLNEKESCEETKFYILSVGKIIIRLSSLIHNERKEEPEEYYEFIQLYLK